MFVSLSYPSAKIKNFDTSRPYSFGIPDTIFFLIKNFVNEKSLHSVPERECTSCCSAVFLVTGLVSLYVLFSIKKCR